MTLSIIIVSFNAREHLELCLMAASRSLKGIEGEIIVVDNNSTDGAPEMIAEKFPLVRLIKNPINLGFSKACNMGWKISSGTAVLFLNPDCIIGETTLLKTLTYLNSHSEAGAIGVPMIDGTGKFLKESKRGNASSWNSFSRLSGLSARFPHSNFFSEYYQPLVNQDSIAEVPVLSGAFFMVKRQVLEKAGGFDERYFMYAEDIDLSISINRLGYRNIYFGEETILHFKGGSTSRDLEFVSRFYNAMRKFVDKYHGPLARLPLLAGIWIRERIARKRIGKSKDLFLPKETIHFHPTSNFKGLIQYIKENPGKIYSIGLVESGNNIG
ncbi:MAG: glycosyltransferase family 2 protein [Flavitalea sp.]